MMFINQYFLLNCNQRGVADKLRGINPIILSAPLANSHPNNCFEPQKFH